jgi:hypothetical protein
MGLRACGSPAHPLFVFFFIVIVIVIAPPPAQGLRA